MTHPHEGVEWFSGEMERKFHLNSHKRGWDDMDLAYGDTRLKQEYEELHLELELFEFGDLDPEDRARVAENIIQEAADVANFAMMVAWKVRHERPSMRNKRTPVLSQEEIDARLATVGRMLQGQLPYSRVEVLRARYVEHTDEETGETYTLLERDELGIGDMATVIAYGPIVPDHGQVLLTVPFSVEMVYFTTPQDVANMLAPKVKTGMEEFLAAHNGSVDQST